MMAKMRMEEKEAIEKHKKEQAVVEKRRREKAAIGNNKPEKEVAEKQKKEKGVIENDKKHKKCQEAAQAPAAGPATLRERLVATHAQWDFLLGSAASGPHDVVILREHSQVTKCPSLPESARNMTVDRRHIFDRATRSMISDVSKEDWRENPQVLDQDLADADRHHRGGHAFAERADHRRPGRGTSSSSCSWTS